MASTGRRASGRGVRRAQSRRPAARRSSRGATRLGDLLGRLSTDRPRRAAPRRAAPRRAPVPPSTGAADTFRPDVEGLRAVAVLLVVADHVLGWPRGGYVGVDVFFVVSGFLITGLLLREHARTGRLSPARVLRPPSPPAAARGGPGARLRPTCCPGCSSTASGPGRCCGTASGRWPSWPTSASRRIGTDYFDETRPASPVQHYWSLSVEEQFYLLWPALLLLALWLGRRRLPVVAVALGAVTAASFAWSLVQTTSSPDRGVLRQPDPRLGARRRGAGGRRGARRAARPRAGARSACCCRWRAWPASAPPPSC